MGELPPRGSNAPRATQARKSATTGAGSADRGGIGLTSPVRAMAWINGLSPGSPGTTTGPESPPRSSPSRLSSRRPPFGAGSFEAWHS